MQSGQLCICVIGTNGAEQWKRIRLSWSGHDRVHLPVFNPNLIRSDDIESDDSSTVCATNKASLFALLWWGPILHFVLIFQLTVTWTMILSLFSFNRSYHASFLMRNVCDHADISASEGCAKSGSFQWNDHCCVCLSGSCFAAPAAKVVDDVFVVACQFKWQMRRSERQQKQTSDNQAHTEVIRLDLIVSDPICYNIT